MAPAFESNLALVGHLRCEVHLDMCAGICIRGYWETRTRRLRKDDHMITQIHGLTGLSKTREVDGHFLCLVNLGEVPDELIPTGPDVMLPSQVLR